MQSISLPGMDSRFEENVFERGHWQAVHADFARQSSARSKKMGVLHRVDGTKLVQNFRWVCKLLIFNLSFAKSESHPFRGTLSETEARLAW